MKKILASRPLNILMLISIASKGMGFLRDLILTYVWGADGVSDAFVISMTIPGTVCDLLVQAIAVGYIPIYTKTRINKNEDKALEFTNSFIALLLLCCIPLCFCIVVFPDVVIKIFASGFNETTNYAAALFIRITIMSILCKMIVSVLSGYLQSNNKYVVPALIGIPFDVVIIFGIILSHRFDIIIMPISVVLAGLVQAVIIIRTSKIGFKWMVPKRVLTEETKSVIRLLIPLLIIVGTNQLNVIVDRTFASFGQVGAVTILDYANKLCLMIENVVVLSIVAILYPQLSEASTQNNKIDFAKSLTNAANKIVLYLLPVCLVLMQTSDHIVSFLFGRGQFSEQNVYDTSICMSFYSLGVCFVALRTIYTRALYAIGRVRYVTFVSVVVLVANIILNFLLSKWLGLKGLAFATSLSSMLNAILLSVDIRKNNSYFRIVSFKPVLYAIILSVVLFLVISSSAYLCRLIGFTGKMNDFMIILITGVSYLVSVFLSERKLKEVLL